MNKNLNHKLTVSEQRKGGKASVKKRKEKKAVRELMTAILDGKVKDNQQFAKLADKLGINDNKSIKEVYTLVCLLNSTKKSNLSDLADYHKFMITVLIKKL